MIMYEKHVSMYSGFDTAVWLGKLFNFYKPHFPPQ